MGLELRVSVLQLTLGRFGVAAEDLQQTFFRFFLSAFRGACQTAKPFDQDGAELLNMADFLFQLVRFFLATNVLGKFLTRLNHGAAKFFD